MPDHRDENAAKFAPKYVMFLVTTLLVILADQATKIMVVRNIDYLREKIEVIPGFLAFVHTQNPGAAIGLLRDAPAPIRLTIFGVFTVIAVAVLLSMLWQLPRRDRFQSFTLALIMGGALGNAIDRIHKQTVTDFVLMYTEWPPIKNWLDSHGIPNEYPTYNIADAAIVVGVLVFLVRYMFLDDSGEEAEPEEVEQLEEPAEERPAP